MNYPCVSEVALPRLNLAFFPCPAPDGSIRLHLKTHPTLFLCPDDKASLPALLELSAGLEHAVFLEESSGALSMLVPMHPLHRLPQVCPSTVHAMHCPVSAFSRAG